MFFDHELRREVLKVTMLDSSLVYFFGCEAANKGLLGGARGQAPNLQFGLFYKRAAFLNFFQK